MAETHPARRLHHRLETIHAVTYFAEDKRYVAGVVHTYLLDDSSDPVFGIQFYPQDLIREEGVVAAVLRDHRLGAAV